MLSGECASRVLMLRKRRCVDTIYSVRLPFLYLRLEEAISTVFAEDLRQDISCTFNTHGWPTGFSKPSGLRPLIGRTRMIMHPLHYICSVSLEDTQPHHQPRHGKNSL